MPKNRKQQFTDDPLWNRRQVAEYLSVSHTTVRRLTYSGALSTVRVAGVVRVRRSVVEAYVERNEAGVA